MFAAVTGIAGVSFIFALIAVVLIYFYGGGKRLAPPRDKGCKL
jgi:apolipoprotein N-acyltransferase